MLTYETSGNHKSWTLCFFYALLKQTIEHYNLIED
jgi:pyruvoyl-dependent arginine decarboxylase (PvlArgDC)